MFCYWIKPKCIGWIRKNEYIFNEYYSKILINMNNYIRIKVLTLCIQTISNIFLTKKILKNIKNKVFCKKQTYLYVIT